ncbi:Uncharacterised protein [Achromobacter xylosoxidans]|nr:Uncharacterised protein [Achromobacter xylosoxidans]
MPETRQILAPRQPFAQAARQPLARVRAGIAAFQFIPHRLGARRGAAVAAARQRRQPAHDAGAQAGAGGRDAARGETGGVQFVVGAKHQGHADQVRARLVHAPGAGALRVDRRVVRGGLQQAGRQRAHQRAAALRLALGRALPQRGGVVIAGRREQRQQRGLGALAAMPREQRRQVARQHRRGRAERHGLVALPKMRRHRLHRTRTGQRHGAFPAIEQLPVIDQRDGGLQHRQPPIQRGLGHLPGLAPARALRRQPVHILGQVAAFTRGGAGLGVQQPAAHIGIQGLARHAQTGGRGGGSQVIGHEGGRWRTAFS